MPLFQGLSAFPPTPTDEHGTVDAEALDRLLERLCVAGVGSIGLLGSTGFYAYLSREERLRAVKAAVASVRGRTPVMVGVGALRTDEAQRLAQDAEKAGADALLLAPVSYTPLTQNEVHEHVRAVAAVTALPICIYNNPGTTHFVFGRDLLERLSEMESIRAVKMPLPADGDFASEIAFLRDRTRLSVGYSGDWGMADALLAGGDAFYSALAGVAPGVALSLARAAQAGDAAQANRLDGLLAPLWETFKAFGSLRVVYVLLETLSLGAPKLPRPLLPLDGERRDRVLAAFASLRALDAD